MTDFYRNKIWTLLEFDKNKGAYRAISEDGFNLYIDPFVGCAIPYDESVSDDENINRWIGRQFFMKDYQPTQVIANKNEFIEV